MTVDLNTPKGCIFSGHADDAELRATDGVITVQLAKQSYLNLTETTQITLRVGTEFSTYVLKNAAASLRDGRLTVLAEEICKIESAEG